jgi:hypothetical protein
MWPLALRDEHSEKVFEKRVLRRIFGWNKDEVTGGWRMRNFFDKHN